MQAKHRKTLRPPAPVLSLAKHAKLPSIRQWAESRPAVDPVLIARLTTNADYLVRAA